MLILLPCVKNCIFMNFLIKYFYVSFSGLVTSVGEERAFFSESESE